MSSSKLVTRMHVAAAPNLTELLLAVWPQHTAKRAANAADCSHRTVQGWLMGRCTPSADTLLRMAARNADLRAELMRQLGKNNGAMETVDSAGPGGVGVASRVAARGAAGDVDGEGSGAVKAAAGRQRGPVGRGSGR